MKELLLIVLLAAVIGCGGDKKDQAGDRTADQSAAATATGDTTVIMPLTIGNRWIYEVGSFDTVLNSYRVQRIDTFLVTGDTVVDGETWYFVKDMTPEGGRVINRSDGLWQYREGIDPFLFLKFPVSDGAEYITQIGPTKVKNIVNGTAEPIINSAGRFSCYKYSHLIDKHSLVVDFYFQPGVGGIRMDIFAENGLKPMSRQELISYELK